MESDRHLLSQLVCPVTGGPLVSNKRKKELVSISAKLAFPVRDGIPIMVIGEARELTQTEVKKLVK